jgi:septum formation protein
VDETALKARFRARHLETAAAALELARAKARLVCARHPGSRVIGADQILDCDGAWFDKPADLSAARQHLRRLRGRDHRLVCAVAVFRDGAELWHHVETARLTLRAFSDEFLERYLREGGAEMLESVGAYRLEGTGAQLFSAIDGDYFTILGLPLLPLLAFLREDGALET